MGSASGSSATILLCEDLVEKVPSLAAVGRAHSVLESSSNASQLLADCRSSRSMLLSVCLAFRDEVVSDAALYHRIAGGISAMSMFHGCISNTSILVSGTADALRCAELMLDDYMPSDGGILERALVAPGERGACWFYC